MKSPCRMDGRDGGSECMSGLCNVLRPLVTPGEERPLSAGGDGGRGRPAGGAGITHHPPLSCDRSARMRLHFCLEAPKLDWCGASPPWCSATVALSRAHSCDAYLELSCISCVCVFATRRPPSPDLAGATSTLIPLCVCVCVHVRFLSFFFSQSQLWLSNNLL